MDAKTAKLLLENLLARVVVDPDSGLGTLHGHLSPHEIEALRMAVAPAKPKPPVTKTKATEAKKPQGSKSLTDNTKKKGATKKVKPLPKTEKKKVVRSKPKLNLASLQQNTPLKPDTKMCLDFGTAMSKAFATVIQDGEIVDNMLLKLGHRASSGKSKAIYPVPSSLWISNEGKIYLGDKAIALSLQADPAGKRQRFDSLKKALILGMKESTPFEQPMPEAQNPTKVEFSTGDAIVLYLGYLTDLACAELDQRYKCSRYVARNFALPSWAPERRVWGEKMLREMLVKAQIVADTFHGQWEDGIDLQDVKWVLEEIDKLDKLPHYLVAKGVTEPLAVAGSRLCQEEEEIFRGLAIVVDVGAGTSDLALFVVVATAHRKLFNAFPVKDCNQSLHMAGDTLDTALQQTILQKAGLKSDNPDWFYITQNLRLRVRALKEDLFRDGYCVANLVNGARLRIELDEFLRHDSVNRFSKSLADKFNNVINAIKKGLAQHFGPRGLSVVLTGGGATLPMVRELASGKLAIHGIQLNKEEIPLIPEEFIGDAEIGEVYPQLAVAIGGAMPILIDEKTTLEDFDVPKGQMILNRAPIQ